MKTIKRSTLAAAVLTAFLAGANAQTTIEPATTALSPEVIAARTQVFEDLVAFVCNDVVAVKAAVAAMDADRAAGLPVAGHTASVQNAKMRLLTDQQQLAAAAKSFLSLGRLAKTGKQAQLQADVAAALNSPRITADKAAVDAAVARVKTDGVTNDAAALQSSKAALDAARRQLSTDRVAALAASLVMGAEQAVLADARQVP
jgi:hypothetical protein